MTSGTGIFAVSLFSLGWVFVHRKNAAGALRRFYAVRFSLDGRAEASSFPRMTWLPHSFSPFGMAFPARMPSLVWHPICFTGLRRGRSGGCQYPEKGRAACGCHEVIFRTWVAKRACDSSWNRTEGSPKGEFPQNMECWQHSCSKNCFLPCPKLSKKLLGGGGACSMSFFFWGGELVRQSESCCFLLAEFGEIKDANATMLASYWAEDRLASSILLSLLWNPKACIRYRYDGISLPSCACPMVASHPRGPCRPLASRRNPIRRQVRREKPFRERKAEEAELWAFESIATNPVLPRRNQD